MSRARLACLALFGALCCHAESLHWKFKRQVVDQQDSPLTNATVELSAHGWSRTRGYGETDQVLRTDKNGVFAVDSRWETVFVTVRKDGFVSKRLDLDPVLVDPAGFPSSGKLVLTRARPLPPLDHFDKLDPEPLEVNDFKPGSSVWLSFLPGHVQTVPVAKAVVRVERGSNGFRITCQPGTQGKALAHEPGLDFASWLASNAFADEQGMAAEFLCATPPKPSLGNNTTAFVLKTRRYWVIVTLSLISQIRPEDFALSFNLSRDNVFVTHYQDSE